MFRLIPLDGISKSYFKVSKSLAEVEPRLIDSAPKGLVISFFLKNL